MLACFIQAIWTNFRFYMNLNSKTMDFEMYPLVANSSNYLFIAPNFKLNHQNDILFI